MRKGMIIEWQSVKYRVQTTWQAPNKKSKAFERASEIKGEAGDDDNKKN